MAENLYEVKVGLSVELCEIGKKSVAELGHSDRLKIYNDSSKMKTKINK